MCEFKSIKVKIYKGAAGNTEWWTDNDWDRHNKYVEQLKRDGEYLKEEEVTVTFKHNPLWDKPRYTEPSNTYKFIILDLSK